MMRNLFYIVALLFSLNSMAQRADGLSLTGQVQLGLPQNDFQEIVNGYPAGFAVAVSAPYGRTGLLRIGGEFAWNSLGKEKTAVELINDGAGILAGDLSSNTDTKSYLGFLRLAPFKGSIRPYGDVILGARSFSNATEISVVDSDGNYSQVNYVIDRQVKSTYGWGAGLAVALGNNAFVDARVQVLRGGRISYVDNNSLRVDTDGNIDYSIKINDTDIVIPQVGLSIFF